MQAFVTEKNDANLATKELVLGYYYQWVMVQENLIDAIYYVASLRYLSGESKDPMTQNGQLTDLEHKNIIKMTKNVQTAKRFLFGTKIKIEPALGTKEKYEMS